MHKSPGFPRFAAQAPELYNIMIIQYLHCRGLGMARTDQAVDFSLQDIDEAVTGIFITAGPNRFSVEESLLSTRHAYRFNSCHGFLPSFETGHYNSFIIGRRRRPEQVVAACANVRVRIAFGLISSVRAVLAPVP